MGHRGVAVVFAGAIIVPLYGFTYRPYVNYVYNSEYAGAEFPEDVCIPVARNTLYYTIWEAHNTLLSE